MKLGYARFHIDDHAGALKIYDKISAKKLSRKYKKRQVVLKQEEEWCEIYA